MTTLSIGQVASRASVRASAIRYYESEGLLPKPARKGGRRVYDASVLDHLLFVRLALQAGFRIGEIKPMVRGLSPSVRPGERWRAVAGKSSWSSNWRLRGCNRGRGCSKIFRHASAPA